MEAEGDMGRMALDRIVLDRAVTTAALITILESQGMEITPTTGLILFHLRMERNPISHTLHLFASVDLLRRIMVTTYLRHRITGIIRLPHKAISLRRRPALASVLHHLATADSGRACSALSTLMDPHRRCPGNGQAGGTRLRMITTDTDTGEDHLA